MESNPTLEQRYTALSTQLGHLILSCEDLPGEIEAVKKTMRDLKAQAKLKVEVPTEATKTPEN